MDKTLRELFTKRAKEQQAVWRRVIRLVEEKEWDVAFTTMEQSKLLGSCDGLELLEILQTAYQRKLTNMTVVGLRRVAAMRSIRGYQSMNKEQLIKHLTSDEVKDVGST